MVTLVTMETGSDKSETLFVCFLQRVCFCFIQACGFFPIMFRILSRSMHYMIIKFKIPILILIFYLDIARGFDGCLPVSQQVPSNIEPLNEKG